VKDYYNKENGASWIYVEDLSKLAVEVYKGMKEMLLSSGKKKVRRSA